MKHDSQLSLSEPEIHPATTRPFPRTLWQTEARGVRCLACTRRCLLHEESVGFCSAVVNWQGQLFSTAYGVVGEASVSPIENRPVYHYRPGSRMLCLGGLGCNLRCRFCQNWEVAFRDARRGGNLTTPNVLPERAISLALERDCSGIAWTFNEPTIVPGYLLDCAKLAHEAGLYTVLVTNGMMTRQALELLGPHLDVYRVDVKSIDPAFYQQVAGTSRITEIIPIARAAKFEYGIHVETVTNLMPTLNDSDDHLSRLTEALQSQLGADTPWHITTYVPYALMTHIPPTPEATLKRAQAIALRAGLRFVYTDNPAAPETAHTWCPDCSALVVERCARGVTIHTLRDDGACGNCGTELGIVLDLQVL